uniref:Uncharacterized protein n=1 Tax=Microviridae sp. ctNWS1 TaxID=2826733 RepID=A0A8S5N3J5_9VIRU|nr:MAG TPA: hypothetical protein [Microviridae sp. ctNWS1]DAF82155.1 MAG TPA: hypothetical protein [Microviridae sp.]
MQVLGVLVFVAFIWTLCSLARKFLLFLRDFLR